MNAARARARAILGVLLFAGSVAAALPAVAGQVRTIAGSGASGFVEGAAAQAQFMMPMGVANGSDGDVFIADAAAQRIFRLTRDGIVETVAGSGEAAINGVYVAGGYRDGRASEARFNHPSAVAVGRDGIYVADMGNHCIRRISAGVVSTFAGSPQRKGANDGDWHTASFSYPRGLLFDNGVLYVADASVGIRMIDPAGKVTTLRLPAKFDRRVTSMAFVGSGPARKMIIANVRGFVALDSNFAVLWERHVKPRYSEALYDGEGNLIKSSLRANRDPVGLPFAITTLGDHQIAYVDPHIHAVRTLDVGSASGAAAILNKVSVDAPFGGAFADGPTTESLFDSPMGIARSNDGNLIVADTSNRRIRRVDDPLAELHAQSPGAADPPLRAHDSGGRKAMLPAHMVPMFDRDAYRISLLGNSLAYWDTQWDDSIPAQLERRLRADAAVIGLRRRPEVAAVYILPTFQALESYANLIVSIGTSDCVIVLLNWGDVVESYPQGKQAYAQYIRHTNAKIVASVQRMYRTLSQSGIPVLFLVHPGPGEITPLEAPTAWQDLVPNRPTGYYSLGFEEFKPPTPTSLLIELLKQAKVPLIDLTPDFQSAEQSPNRRALFGSQDYHFTSAGRKLVAESAVAGLEQLRPWATSAPR